MKYSLILALFASFPAFAADVTCPNSTHPYHDLALTADGRALRTAMVEKLGEANKDSQNGTVPPVRYVRVVKDTVTLVAGDDLVLNAAPRVVDALFQMKVSFVSAERDEKGFFSTTYHVTEISTALFGGNRGPNNKSAKSYQVKVTSNYAGNGTYLKSCGSVTKSTWSEIDPRSI
ncbi:MAG: hypothetical protein H7301_00010 [Cryobacterium sp.]|nr:hypothetical protein [Oligoflexia bacterium]